MSILDRFSLEGKVALITGGAGLYGKQLVAALAEAGATTIMASRNVDALQEVANEHNEQGRDVHALQFDQGDEASVLALRDTVFERFGRVDTLVNNAVLRSMKQQYRSDADSFAESMRVNATGLFVITRAFADAMAQHNGNGGSIINIGSIYGMVAPDPTNYAGTDMNGWSPDYAFHKGAMVTFTKFIASYYGPNNIRCNCISAGGFFNNQHPQFVKQYSDRTFLGRMAGDHDLQGILVFLASDASSYVTGTNIPVDGGYTSK
jgi:NAD(P)-dependent dehydrogenase (short-subunit alcohol dehydrogenase family)